MFSFLLSPSAWLGALTIFCLRITDMSLDTLRMLFVMRGRKALVWTIGLFQSAVFVIAITKVLSNLNNPLTVLGYAAGFASGNLIGMIVEERLAIGHITLQIISQRHGVKLAKALRMAGYGVTEMSARGKDGTVRVLSASVLRKDLAHARHIVYETDEAAFMTSEDVRPIRRGFWRA
jgi:uncharacterized protein YebE (UPF0316 family)